MLHKYKNGLIILGFVLGFCFLATPNVSATPLVTGFAAAAAAPGDVCGAAPNSVVTSINIGCTGKGNPITDVAFAIIRFLSIGVGLVLTGSMVFAGIQYTASRGDPKATAEAMGRIRSNITALLIFIFAYAILNYLIPAGFFQ